MPYVPGGTAHGVVHVADVYSSPNVFANNVQIALWKSPGTAGVFSFNGLTPPVTIEALAVANTTTDFPTPITSTETTFIAVSLDADGVQDASSSTYEATRIQENYQQGILGGIITGITNLVTSIFNNDTTPPPVVSTATNVGADWTAFNKNNIPYDTLMLTPKTPLRTFTKQASLWPNQPKPFGPDSLFTSNNPNRGDNKHIREQDIFIKGKKVGHVTVPQILHNLSNLAANIWEPIKAKYPNAVITNTFRQNKPYGGSEQAQHGLGMAMDIVFPGATAEQYLEIAKWCRDNLPFDQLLQEKAGATRWIHISHYSGFGYKVPSINRVANCVVSPTYSFTPGLALMV